MEEAELIDRNLTCKTCQKDFAWSKQEQKYYAKKGFKKQPQKCTACRDKANKLRGENMFYIHCGICEKDAVMIAPPPKDRVAICSNCYQSFVDQAKKEKTAEAIA